MERMVPGAMLAREAEARVLASARSGAVAIPELLSEILYFEQVRLSTQGENARTKDDLRFIAAVRQDLVEARPEDAWRLFERWVRRYSSEIEGHFDPLVYRAATTLLPVALNALLHGTTPLDALARVRELPRLTDRVLVSGEVETLLRLAEVGTVVLLPTHVSNLDSLLLGYTIFKLGLPPFIYGAGLNLFESKITGYFMRNLGAYTVDRAKRDPTYKSLVKEYATAALQHGQHGLFFPGGTRSRSGALETGLKKGLLGTSVTAFRRNLIAGQPRPRVFLFPCTCSYPLVLEDASLVEDFLNRAGKGRYLQPPLDESDRLERWTRFFRHVLSLDLDVHVRVSRPIDPFGCEVDDEGQSLDPRGRRIDPAGYLEEEGELVEDTKRDEHYTRLAEQAVLAAYRRDNVALCTSVVSYVVLLLVAQRERRADVFRLLRLVGPGSTLARADILVTLGTMLRELRDLEARGGISMADETRAAPDVVLERALSTFGTYHDTPVLEARGEAVVLGDLRLVYYYRNRLDGYGLLGAPSLLPEPTR